MKEFIAARSENPLEAFKDAIEVSCELLIHAPLSFKVLCSSPKYTLHAGRIQQQIHLHLSPCHVPPYLLLHIRCVCSVVQCSARRPTATFLPAPK